MALVVVALAIVVGGWRLSHPAVPTTPRLVGRHLSEVPLVLEQAGLAPADAEVMLRQTERQHVGMVIDQQPQPGLPSSPDSPIKIVVGSAQ
jgi:beta-lactam-binding protein with PASTA domain